VRSYAGGHPRRAAKVADEDEELVMMSMLAAAADHSRSVMGPS
jgi:hypothetical protein